MATPFIIIVFLIIIVCVVLAVIVGIFMHTNSRLGGAETEQENIGTMPEEAQMQPITGPLPPFLLNPTQPLSEIYYHDEQIPLPEPLPLQPDPSHMPPTGPLPIYHNNQ